MKISYNWLKTLVATELTAQQIGDILTDTGLEVEGVEKVEAVPGGLKGVYVAEVLTCEPHPDADKLKVTTVTIGHEPLQVVCGAPNVAKGQKVLLATVGTTLYPKPEEPLTLKVSKIRGVESHGMLCAEDELGLGTSHAGIMVLDENAQVGLPASLFFNMKDDYCIEIGLTPNRSDAMGHIGVARDLIAYLNYHQQSNLELLWPKIEFPNIGDQKLPIQIKVEEPELCPRYAGVCIDGIKVAPSPEWLQQYLRVVGLQPINNVVDVTNFVMRELGTPLHAFDYKKTKGEIVVKKANEGEVFVTLDGVERKLSGNELMIANAEESMCIAGVYGGLSSGVSNESQSIFLESAFFNPVSVRKTAKHHGLSTDASFRFERGVDPELTITALQRAAALIVKLCGGHIASETIEHYPQKLEPKQIDFDFKRCNQLLGTQISSDDIKKILLSLDIKILKENENQATLELPLYRTDVTREIDVFEEILRIYGFNNVPMPEKLNTSIPVFPKLNSAKIQNTIADFLVGKGCHELLNNSLTSSNYVDKMGSDVFLAQEHVEILNPLSQELNVLRQSLIFGVLENIEHNQNRQNPDLKLFEFGKTYFKKDNNFNENMRLIIALSGRKEQESWNSNNDSQSFYAIKGLTQAVLEKLGLLGLLKAEKATQSILNDAVDLNVLKLNIGTIGSVPSKIRKQFGIKSEVFIADLNWDALLEATQFSKIKYVELPKTFEVRRDFSLLIPKEISFNQIETIAKNSDKKLLKRVNLFDVYEGKNLEDGKKSYAVSFHFQDAEQTLKDSQIDAIMEKIRLALEKECSATLR